MAVDEHAAHGEILPHAHQGIVHAGVPVGVVLAQHVPHGGGAFLIGIGVGKTAFVHGVQDAPVHGLQPVPHVRQGAAHDDGHGVVDIARLHFADQLGFGDRLIREGDVLRLVITLMCHSFLLLLPIILSF